MKKLYFLNEEEKNRILNLHENATKRQYLSEERPGLVNTPKTQPINQNDAVDRDRNWTNDYNCVRKIQGVTTSKLKDNTTVYINKTSQGNFIYYNNGALQTPQGKMANFKCEGDKVMFIDDRLWKLPEMSCVPSQQGAIDKKLDDGSTVYQIGNVIYYNNGRKKLADGTTMTGYTCATEFKTNVSTEDKAKKIQQYKQQIITKTEDTTKQIQALLGLEKTGVMDSGLLQKINDKLNGGGTSSAPAASSSTPAKSSSTKAYNFNIDPNIGKDGINFNQMTPEQIAQGVKSATPPQEPIAATTPPTNKEKRQQIRDLRAANKAEMRALRDKQRGNQ